MHKQAYSLQTNYANHNIKKKISLSSNHQRLSKISETFNHRDHQQRNITKQKQARKRFEKGIQIKSLIT